MTIRPMLKVCSVAALVLLLYIGLGPLKIVPRSALGREIDHYAGYFVFALLVCLAWPRPLKVGGALTVFAVLLEGLQAFPPDRSSNVFAAVFSAAGVLSGAMLAELFIRARSRFRAAGNA